MHHPEDELSRHVVWWRNRYALNVTYAEKANTEQQNLSIRFIRRWKINFTSTTIVVSLTGSVLLPISNLGTKSQFVKETKLSFQNHNIMVWMEGFERSPKMRWICYFIKIADHLTRTFKTFYSFLVVLNVLLQL